MNNSLTQYENKYIRLIATDNEIYEGFVSDYIDPIDNENNMESIILDIENKLYPIEFYPYEIASVEILKR